MGAPVQNRGNKRGPGNQRGRGGKVRGQGRSFNGQQQPPFGNPGMMRPRGGFRGGIRPPPGPPVRGGRPPMRGGRPIPPPPRMMGPMMHPMRPPPPGMRPPHPGCNRSYPEYRLEEGKTNGDREEMRFCCEPCDRDFVSKFQYDRHVSQHRTCNLDGCKFTAHEKIVEKHVAMQHASGLYDKIRNINTPEEIAKWVEERKRRYPNKENVLKRREKQEQMLKRGERIKKNDNRFGRNKFRLSKIGNSKVPPKKKMKRPFVKETKPVSLINEKCDWNGRMYPFKGTTTMEPESDKVPSDYEDEEWINKPPKNVGIKLNNALGALIGAYMSGSDTEDEKPTEVVNEKKKDEGEPPPEVQETVVTKAEVVSGRRKRKRQRPLTKKRPDVKSAGAKDGLSYKFKKRKVTLLEKLLENEIRHERNVLLQCVRYVVENKFFVKENETC
ncbi:FMR1-interacting protein NUFIP1 isoform X1 [Diorhabda carinulata]|uniref:FMR1-interacting protein NUFIP1 isoform X1 n=2 Tax=Diorhabda carinulata TaxID=1163345 RepID=UPI0025A060DD|nr:FMR1-interacting protein NUFIP1 isoform X1 [Diorhabda carinulata]